MILLVNPWIYDFTAYDLWAKPLGLLYVASLLRDSGIEVDFIDCLGNYGDIRGKSHCKADGSGKFKRTIVEKPDVLSHIPRNYARYGIDPNEFRHLLEKVEKPDAIFVTSIMTYWYLGISKVFEILREVLPGVPIVLGGIYASLMPEHAKATLKPDIVFSGPAEFGLWSLLDELNILYNTRLEITHFSQMPNPAQDLISEPDYGLCLTTRACPMKCSFCAQSLLYPRFEKRKAADVVSEILSIHEETGLRDFAFYDDALFVDADNHIKIILDNLCGKNLRFHTPNGLFVGLIDAELANLLKRVGFSTLRLSLETIDPSLYTAISGKINVEEFLQGVDNLQTAGFSREELGIYIMMGLPNQEDKQVIETIDFINKMGLIVKLNVFSPVHGTQAFNTSCESGMLSQDIDPLLTNETAFAMAHNQGKWQRMQEIREYVRTLNKNILK